MGFTHVEFYRLPGTPTILPGVTRYDYAPTSRYGFPKDFMYLVDQLHQAQIGVIIDWCRPISHGRLCVGTF